MNFYECQSDRNTGVSCHIADLYTVARPPMNTNGNIKVTWGVVTTAGTLGLADGTPRREPQVINPANGQDLDKTSSMKDILGYWQVAFRLGYQCSSTQLV